MSSDPLFPDSQVKLRPLPLLKVKLAMAIIGISSIHLLRTFIEAGALGQPNGRITESAILWQTVIHMIFILSAIGIAWVDRMTQQRN
ncbi:MAG: hypothetical protein WBR13_15295 [Allosphingosinicella sp.]